MITWQLWVHGLLLSLIHSNHKYSHLCFSLSSLNSNWRDHQALDINLDLDNHKRAWRQTPLDLTHSISTPSKMWLGFFLLYLRQNIKPYTSYGLGLSWKFCRKNILHEVRSIESNFRSIEPCRNWIVISCNYSISALHINTLWVA